MMIFYLYITWFLITGEPQHEVVGPVGPSATECVKVAQYVINRRVAKGGIKHYVHECNWQTAPR